jgi:hypothetical protein
MCRIRSGAERCSAGVAIEKPLVLGLWVGFTWVEWNGVFPTEAFEVHREQKLEVA